MGAGGVRWLRRRPGYARPTLRTSRAIRAAAWCVMAAGVAAPVIRRRARLPAPLVLAAAAAAPVALSVALPRTRARDAAVVSAADVGLRRRLRDAQRRSRAPARAGEGRLPGADRPRARARRAAGDPPPAPRLPPRARSGATRRSWSGRTGSGSSSRTGRSAYILLFHRDRFESAAARMYATFDVGVVLYWLAPDRAAVVRRPARARWRAARRPAIRRMMIEYGEAFWREKLGPPLRCPRGQPARRHALTALRHVGHGRASADRDRSGPRRGRAGPMP